MVHSFEEVKNDERQEYRPGRVGDRFDDGVGDIVSILSAVLLSPIEHFYLFSKKIDSWCLI